MENRSGLLVDACLTQADGHAERVAALHMIEPHADRPRAITLGADKGYDAEDFVNELRSMKVTPHVAQNTSGRRSAIDGRTTRHAGYAVSQRIRKRIEEAFGWIKTVAGQEKTQVPRHRPRRLGLHLRRRGLQSGATAQAARGGRLMAKVPAFAKAFAGRWRIVEMDVWDNDVLDLVEEAHITFQGEADGEIAFGAVNGYLDVRYGSRDGSACAEFSWEGLRRRRPRLRPRLGHDRHRRPPRRPLLHPQRRRLQASSANATDFFNSLLDAKTDLGRDRRQWRSASARGSMGCGQPPSPRLTAQGPLPRARWDPRAKSRSPDSGAGRVIHRLSAVSQSGGCPLRAERGPKCVNRWDRRCRGRKLVEKFPKCAGLGGWPGHERVEPRPLVIGKGGPQVVEATPVAREDALYALAPGSWNPGC